MDGTIDAATTNGKIKLHGGTGRIHAITTNGSIELHGGAGRIHAVTTNGKIEASIELLTDEGKFVTTNGSVDVEIRRRCCLGVGKHEKRFNQFEATREFLWSA